MSRLCQVRAHTRVFRGKVIWQQWHGMFPNRTRLGFTPQLSLELIGVLNEFPL